MYVAHFLTISGFTDSDDLAQRLQWLPEKAVNLAPSYVHSLLFQMMGNGENILKEVL